MKKLDIYKKSLLLVEGVTFLSTFLLIRAYDISFFTYDPSRNYLNINWMTQLLDKTHSPVVIFLYYVPFVFVLAILLAAVLEEKAKKSFIKRLHEILVFNILLKLLFYTLLSLSFIVFDMSFFVSLSFVFVLAIISRYISFFITTCFLYVVYSLGNKVHKKFLKQKTTQ